MEFEKLSEKKFQKLTKEELSSLSGGQLQLLGWHIIYDNQALATVDGQADQATGSYGYKTFLGIRVSDNGFQQTDSVQEN